MTLGERSARVPVVVYEGREYVSVRTMSEALGIELEREPNGSVRLLFEGSELLFPSALPSMARTGSGYLSLGGDALRQRRDLYVPAGAVGRMLDSLSGLTGRSGGAAAGMRVSLVGSGPGGLTLSIDLPEPALDLSYELTPRGRWLVEFRTPSPLALPWRRKALGHDLIESLRLHRQGRLSLILELLPGPGLEAMTAERRDDPPGIDLRMIARPVGEDDAAATTTWAGALEPRIRRVVLDPGHGGSEDGAVGRAGLKEKDLVLDVARLLAARLRAEGFEVILTRDEDKELALDDRAPIANNVRADLFVSLHANASRFERARGAETYFLAREATDDEARTTAALENNAAGAPNEPARDSDLSLILWDLAQVEHLEESASLAETIQNELNEVLDIRDRGVRQAPFRVLVGATCASVLVELGFLTNPDEERLLASPSYRRLLATALADAIESFREAEEARFAPPFGVGQ